MPDLTPLMDAAVDHNWALLAALAVLAVLAAAKRYRWTIDVTALPPWAQPLPLIGIAYLADAAQQIVAGEPWLAALLGAIIPAITLAMGGEAAIHWGKRAPILGRVLARRVDVADTAPDTPRSRELAS